MPELLPGEFAIRTFDTNNYVSWSWDLFSRTGTLTTSATTLGPNEKFKLTNFFQQYTLIQTLDGQYVTVAPGGGLTITQGMEEGSPPTLFTLIGPQNIQEPYVGSAYPDGLFGFNIRTSSGTFVSAVNGGGMTSNAFLTDVTVPQDWEAFSILKTGDVGSGYRYHIKPFGRQITGPVFSNSPYTPLLARPPSDGWYALLTGDSFNYVTALNGGGVNGAAAGDPEVFHYDAWKPLSWEIFNIVDQGDGTYCIQTSSGYYIGYNNSGSGVFSTDISFPDTPPPGWITKFEFLMVRTPVHGDVVLALGD